MDDLISVVVPVFRVNKFLNRCMNSILEQTYTNLEIIIVDDGSDDSCPSICDEYAYKDNRVIVIHQENSGLSMARNSGISLAVGKYIAFVDSDDYISCQYINFLYRAITESDADISQCCYIEFKDGEIPAFAEHYTIPNVWNNKKALISQFTPGLNIVSTVAWNKLYKTSLFDNIRYTPGKLHEDEFTTYRLFEASDKIVQLTIPLYAYFQNDHGIMHSTIKAARIDALEAKIQRFFFLEKAGYTDISSMAAKDCFDNLLIMSSKIGQAKDRFQYRGRLQTYLTTMKSKIPTKAFNRLDRTILKYAKTPEQLVHLFRLYLTLGGFSKKLRIAEIRQGISIRKMMEGYDKELQDLFHDYIPEKTVFIIGAVEYENLGDQAIVMAQRQFIQNVFPNYRIVEIREDLFIHVKEKLNFWIKPESILTLPGGGNMGDIWFDDEKRRRDIIREFPNNRIVVFPQTIDYSNSENGKKLLEESVRLYNSHTQLTLCAREEISFELMRQYYPKCKVLLTPDIVLSIKPQIKRERADVLVCLRNDKEKKTSFDILDVIRAAADEGHFHYRYTDTIADTLVYRECREERIMDKLSEFCSSKLVITDRLHGMIFAAITSTPCIVLPNGNHKVKGIYDLWLHDCPFLYYTEELTSDRLVEIYRTQSYSQEAFSFDMKQFNQLREALING